MDARNGDYCNTHRGRHAGPELAATMANFHSPENGVIIAPNMKGAIFTTTSMGGLSAS
jgi:hypothetical protein